MVNTFLRKAAVGESVYITDVREAFQARGTRPFHIHVTLYDRAVRVFPLTLPETSGEAEAGFVAEYVHACIYNILSALGALGVDIYLDRRDWTGCSRRTGPRRSVPAMERVSMSTSG